MLRETKTKKTIGFFCHIFLIVCISIGGGAGPLDPLAKPKGGGDLLLKHGIIDGYAY